jgi:hypothetical protein
VPAVPAVPAVARELAPQVLAGAAALARSIDHERALDALRQRERRLAASSWLQERQELRRSEAERQLPQMQARLQDTQKLLPPEARYRALRESLARSAQALEPPGSPRRQGMH